MLTECWWLATSGSLGGREGVVLDCLNDVLEEDLGGTGVAVVDDWLLIVSVPAVHCEGRERAEGGEGTVGGGTVRGGGGVQYGGGTVGEGGGGGGGREDDQTTLVANTTVSNSPRC